MSLPIIKQNGTEIDVTFYLYRPSEGAAYTFVALFGLTTIAHVVCMFVYRSWHFIPLILGAALESLAYYGRAWSHAEPKSIGAWALYAMLTYPAPVLLAATLYMTLCRIIVAIHAAEHSLISPRWLVKLFVLVDVIVFISQLAGIGLQATGDAGVMSAAAKAIAAGLGFQLAMLFLFGIIAIKVDLRCRRAVIEKSTSNLAEMQKKGRKYFVAVYIGTIAVALRSLVRLIEFAQGSEGTIARYEAFQYIFDGVPMLLLVATFLAIHPGRLIMQTIAYRSMQWAN